MYALELAAGCIALTIWLYLLFARGSFWRIRPPRGAEPVAACARIAAIIPARNEAGVIGQSIASLINHAPPVSLQVIVVDDNSEDATAQTALAAARTFPDSAAVIQGQPLPPGWSGKLWAVHQGVEYARHSSPDFLLLTDADVVHDSTNVVTLVTLAQRDGYDLVSFMVKLHCQSFAEKLLIPPFVYFFFKLYPPAWISNDRHSTAGAAGGCMLVRLSALDRIGGIAAIRNQIIDDCALARAVKQTGGRVYLAPTETAHSIRPYGGFSGIGHMIARTAFNQLQHSAVLLIAALAGLALTYLVPVALLFSARGIPTTLGALTLALMTASFLPTARLYRLNPLWAVTLPFAALFYMAATLKSAFNYWSGRGGEWKGRTQDK